MGLISAAWEADIWGRIRRLNESAKAQYLSTEDAKRGVMLSLVSDVAQAYFELLGLNLQLEIAKENTESFSQTLKLFTQRLEGGVASKLQTSRAAAAQATAAATIPEFERQIALKENQISVLLDRIPARLRCSQNCSKKSFRQKFPPACLPPCWSAGRMCSQLRNKCGLPTLRLGSRLQHFSRRLASRHS